MVDQLCCAGLLQNPWFSLSIGWHSNKNISYIFRSIFYISPDVILFEPIAGDQQKGLVLMGSQFNFAPQLNWHSPGEHFKFSWYDSSISPYLWGFIITTVYLIVPLCCGDKSAVDQWFNPCRFGVFIINLEDVSRQALFDILETLTQRTVSWMTSLLSVKNM